MTKEIVEKEVSGVVSRIGSVIRGGNSLFFVLLSGDTVPYQIRSGIQEECAELALTHPNDRVSFRVRSVEAGYEDVYRFSNLELSRKKS